MNKYRITIYPGMSYEFEASSDREAVQELRKMLKEGRYGNLDPSWNLTKSTVHLFRIEQEEILKNVDF